MAREKSTWVYYSKDPNGKPLPLSAIPESGRVVESFFGPEEKTFTDVLTALVSGKAEGILLSRLDDLGDGYREILGRLVAVHDASGVVWDLETKVLAPNGHGDIDELRVERLRTVVDVLEWVRDSERSRHVDRIRRGYEKIGSTPGRPWPCRNPECGHYRNTHMSGAGACDLCECKEYQGATR